MQELDTVYMNVLHGVDNHFLVLNLKLLVQ